jgi:hypothetical protein
MNYAKIVLTALSILGSPNKVFSLNEIEVDLYADNVVDLHVIDSSSTRELEQAELRCKIFAKASCTVDFNERACERYWTTQDNCGLLAITMKYQMCNENANKYITYIQEKTEAKVLSEFIEFNTAGLEAQTCRTSFESLQIDTCATLEAVGSMKLEGNIDIGFKENGEIKRSYCYAYSHYRTKMVRTDASDPDTASPTQVTSPTQSPLGPIDFTLEIECLVELNQGSEIFNLPCEDINFSTFSDPQQLNRSVRFRFIINNFSNESLDITLLDMMSNLLDTDEKFFDENTSESVGANSEFILEYTIIVPFGDYNGDIIEVDAEINTVGSVSKQTGEEDATFDLEVP